MSDFTLSLSISSEEMKETKENKEAKEKRKIEKATKGRASVYVLDCNCSPELSCLVWGMGGFGSHA